MATLAERIETRSMPEPNSGCWLWLGSMRKPAGYGCLHVNGGSESAHRASWMAFRGPIPAGKFVCHRCDIKSCVNPAHLFLASHAGNMADMKAKGRAARPTGEKQGAHKLTEASVREILALPSPVSVILARQLAARYGVRPSYIYGIRAGKAWNHISGLPAAVRPAR